MKLSDLGPTTWRSRYLGGPCSLFILHRQPFGGSPGAAFLHVSKDERFSQPLRGLGREERSTLAPPFMKDHDGPTLAKPAPGGPVRPYLGEDHLDVVVGNLKRRLPVVKVEKGVWIASDANLILGDGVFIQRCAELLASRLKRVPIDAVLTAEAKAIPLAFAVSSLLGKERFLVARKSVKKYMGEFVEEEVRSITTEGRQKLVLPSEDAVFARGKRICIIDDVVSTGATLDALARLARKAGGRVVSKCVIWKEGAWYRSRSLVYIGTLPVFLEPGTRQAGKRLQLPGAG